MDFAEFIAPMTVETFMSDYFGSRPVHIRGETARAGLLSTARLEQLLAVLPHWTEDNLKLILNSRPILGEHFLEKADVNGGRRRADPAKVQLFLRIGASLVGDHIEDIDPVVRQAAAMLSDQFAGTAGANVYCSFQGIRAFDSHFDLHEVFAVQLEGEKTWQIYENRAEAPVEALQGENAQAIIDQAKGKVMMTVRMQPGDLLYIPRGYFHDALADSSASLHLTFGIRPLGGRYVFRLLEELAVKDRQFREYLPDGRANSEGLRAHLAGLADELAAVIRSPLFETLLTNRQRALVIRADSVDLQDRGKLDYYAATGQRGELVWTPDGIVLRHARGEESLGASGEAMEWVLDQQAFSLQQLQANFRWLSEEEAQRLVEFITRTGLFAAYEPAL
jgi:bifunctional lysine-specific demethylase and histidyl-hydroxylase NO66